MSASAVMAICVKVSLDGEQTGGMWKTKLELLKVKAESFLLHDTTRQGVGVSYSQ